MFHDMPLNLHVDYITFSNKITNNMNKIKLILLALAAFMFSACSSEDTENGGGNNNVDVSYLSVNIQNVGEAMSRAEYDDQKGGTYEDGTEAESKISDVRFYFFNADGSPYLLKKKLATDPDHNWMTPSEDINGTDKDNDHTVEQISKTVLVINGENKVAPHSVVAVINSSSLTKNTLGENALGNGALSLSELREKQDTKFYNAGANFVMSNSIYMKDNNEEYAVPVSGHVYTSDKEAEKDPIEIYVERVAAKVTTTLNTSHENWEEGTASTWGEEKWAYKLSEKLNNKYDVYAVVDGWSVADANGRATVEKAALSGTWTNNLLGINPWTTGDYHRCFWETSVPFTDDNKVVNQSFEAITTNFGNSVYTLPNTPAATTDFADKMENSLTKVIVAAHLYYKDENGNYKPAEICKYKGIQYLGAKNVLKVVANEIKNTYCKKDADGSFVSITEDDLAFETSVPTGSTTQLMDYEVIPQINSKKTIELFDNEHHPANINDVNKALAAEANKAQVRTKGCVYYYTPIRHIAANDTYLGYYGVVRNHSYKVNIQEIKGFGTPVFDPKKEIDPTLPEEKDVYLAARINVLSWRVVNSNVNLDSNKNSGTNK